MMKYYPFFKKINDRTTKKYCKNCNNLWLEMQMCLHESLRDLNSDLVHKRRFKICVCLKSLQLPKERFCKSCLNDKLKLINLKRKVRELTQYCIRHKIIEKPSKCELCNNVEIEAHHVDYYQPFKVRWLCKNHHAKEHTT